MTAEVRERGDVFAGSSEKLCVCVLLVLVVDEVAN